MQRLSFSELNKVSSPEQKGVQIVVRSPVTIRFVRFLLFPLRGGSASTHQPRPFLKVRLPGGGEYLFRLPEGYTVDKVKATSR